MAESVKSKGLRGFAGKAAAYDAWYDEMAPTFDAEARAVRYFLPPGKEGRSLEVGIGTGRFAQKLGIRFGADPCPDMVAMARQRGVDCVLAVAESLPFASRSLACVLMVTALCFVDNAPMAMAEIRRVLRPNGRFVLGFIDRNSHLGRSYEAKKKQSRFYADANFYCVDEVLELLRGAGFTVAGLVQTLFPPAAKPAEAAPVIEGAGQGAFVVVGAEAE